MMKPLSKFQITVLTGITKGVCVALMLLAFCPVSNSAVAASNLCTKTSNGCQNPVRTGRNLTSLFPKSSVTIFLLRIRESTAGRQSRDPFSRSYSRLQFHVGHHVLPRCDAIVAVKRSVSER